ncbi:GntR family transcriptional regulator [Oceaniglobus roseus]|uniref:GntR family transcriptional regulator n=1 Tax=Oceaniglobus roseus TaxID=1737570 RepID=UPI000C7ECCB8|nr:GntR family transcriptional regulator [Kandeliimicrobium roseum]
MYDPSSPLLRSAVGAGAPPAPEAKARFAEDRLLDAVIWCEIRPGATVTEADVMERFGLTRAAARAGLARLGYDGWAQPQARAGWQVLPVTGALIGHVLQARRSVEPALADATLNDRALKEVAQIAAILTALRGRPEAAAVATHRSYVDRIDGLLLGAINPFTARHLRKLWHHSARITRFLEDAEAGVLFHRVNVLALAEAILAGDRAAIAESRLNLIASQEAFFLRQLLKSDAPLTPGSGVVGHWSVTTATDRRAT